MRFMTGLSLLLVGGLVTSCGSTPEEPPADDDPIPTSIELTPATVSLIVGTTQQLTAVVRDADGDVIPAAAVTYTSSDTTVARVGATGVVAGVGAGTGTITVRCPPASAATVVIVANPTSLSIGGDVVVPLNAPTPLATVVLDDDGEPMPNPPVAYLSRTPSLVTVSQDGVVTALDVGSAYVVATIGTLQDSARVTGVIARLAVPGRPFGAAVSGAGVGYVTDANGSSVARLGLVTHAMTGSVAVGSTPSSVTFDQAGNRAYVGNQSDGTVSIVDVASGTVVATPAFGSSVLSVAVAPGDTLLLVGADVRLYWLRLADLTITDSVALPGYTNALVLRDTLLYASVPSSGVVQEINILTGAVTRTLSVGGVPQGLVLPAAGTQLYVANETGQLQVWNLTTNTLTGSVPLPGGGGFGLGVNPANGLLYVSTSYYGGRVHVIDPVARTVLRVIHTGGVPRRIGFAPTGNVGIVTNEGGWVDYIR